MKKTSIFFLALSLVLILVGFILKGQAVDAAEKDNVQLFKQELKENGDLVQTIDFKPEDANRVIVSLQNTDVNIIGGADKCYVEIVNFSFLDYSAYISNKALNIDNDFISALIGRAETGKISFNGVRDYMRFEKHNEEKKVNIYLTEDSEITRFEVKLNKGNVNVDNIGDIVCDYEITIHDGNFECDNTYRISSLNAQIKNGNVKVSNTYIENTELNIENGDVSITSPSNVIYDFDVTNMTGDIIINGETYKTKYFFESEEPNGKFVAKVGVGDINFKYSENEYVVPGAPTTDETPAEEQAPAA